MTLALKINYMVTVMVIRRTQGTAVIMKLLCSCKLPEVLNIIIYYAVYMLTYIAALTMYLYFLFQLCITGYSYICSYTLFLVAMWGASE